jgi:hypothetical protein
LGGLTVIDDRYLYVFGGSGDWGALFNELWMFDTGTRPATTTTTPYVGPAF